jgi:hypothetical protein
VNAANVNNTRIVTALLCPAQKATELHNLQFKISLTSHSGSECNFVCLREALFIRVYVFYLRLIHCSVSWVAWLLGQSFEPRRVYECLFNFNHPFIVSFVKRNLLLQQYLQRLLCLLRSLCNKKFDYCCLRSQLRISCHNECLYFASLTTSSSLTVCSFFHLSQTALKLYE